MGSSMVRILISSETMVCRAAYRVVVLPLPVGPVTRMMPWGRVISDSKFSSTSLDMPNCWSDRLID